MTDEELIKQLREAKITQDLRYTLEDTAADRIEQLIVTNEQLVRERDAARNNHWQVEAMQQNALLHDALTRAETAEDKLAKAVEALREIKSVECEYCTDYFHQLANEVLAELEKTE